MAHLCLFLSWPFCTFLGLGAGLIATIASSFIRVDVLVIIHAFISASIVRLQSHLEPTRLDAREIDNLVTSIHWFIIVLTVVVSVAIFLRRT